MNMVGGGSLLDRYGDTEEVSADCAIPWGMAGAGTGQEGRPNTRVTLNPDEETLSFSVISVDY